MRLNSNILQGTGRDMIMDIQTILRPIRSTVLTWINRYPLATKHNSLRDLSNGQFFKHMLDKVDGFRWVEGGDWANYSEVPTGERVKRMRVIGRSIMKFYQSQLDLSLDILTFNCIEMCTSTEESDILRFLIAVIGVLVRSEEIVSQLQDLMVQLGEEELGLFKIMIDYASKIGDQIGQLPESPRKRQKRLVSKLESLEEDLEFYEHYTEQLQSKTQELADQLTSKGNIILEIQTAGDTLVKRIQNLEQINEQLVKQIDCKVRDEDILNRRLKSNNKTAEEVVDRLFKQNSQQKEEIEHFRKALREKDDKDAQLKVLTAKFEENTAFIEELQARGYKQLENASRLEKENLKLKFEGQELTSERLQLKTKIELYEKAFKTNQPLYFSPDQQSIIISKCLGDSFVQKSPNEWFLVEEDRRGMNESGLAQSMTLSQRSEQSIAYPQQKGFLNLKDLHSLPETNKQNEDPNILKNIGLNEIEEQRSMQIPNKDPEYPDLQFQLQLAMSTIFDLHTNLHSARKELLSYKAKEAKRAERQTHFAAKVASMFN